MRGKYRVYALAWACGSCRSGGEDAATDGEDSTAASSDNDSTGTGSTGDTGGDTSTYPLAQSGTRLKTVTQLADDGTEVFLGLYDDALATRCNFLRATDDRQRCLPQTTGHITNLFADSACTAALIASDACGNAPAYTSTLVEHPCGSATEIRRVGERHTGSIYLRVSDTQCEAFATDTPYYLSGEIIDPTTFVAGDEMLVPGSTRLRTRLLRADDGALLVLGPRDSHHGADASLGTLDDGNVHWRPSTRASVANFYDASCEQELIMDAFAVTCGDSSIAIDLEFRECQTQATFHALGSGVEPEQVHMFEAQQCIVAPADRTAEHRFYQRGDSVAPDMFLLPDPIDVGGSRLAHTLFRGDGAQHFDAGQHLADREFDEASCTFSFAGDGELRCLPVTRVSITTPIFADPDCQVPLAEFIPSACDSTRPRFASSQIDPTACDAQPRTMIHELGAVHLGPLYREDPTCVGIDRPLDREYLLLGEEVAAATFVRAQVVIDGG